MKVLVVATPLFDHEMSVEAYRLCDQSGEKAFNMKKMFAGTAEVFLSPGLDLVSRVGVETFAGDKLLFAAVNPLQLLTGTPTNLKIPVEKLVCILPCDIDTDEQILERCRNLKELGYRLAMEGLPAEGGQNPLLPLVDYLFLDYADRHFDRHYKAAQALSHLVPIVTGIPDPATFETLSQNKNLLLGGHFYRQPITAGISRISPVKINLLQLLRHVNERDFELTEIAKIVERDPALSISLLRFINSAAVGLPRRVGSIQAAVAILGQEEVRRWATVAISVQLAEDRPGEITKLSLLRAKFAENLATCFELGVFQPSLFMAGLFSLLDVILQRPMAESLREVAVDERVQRALLEPGDELHRVLELIYTYERADWDKVSIQIIQNNTSIEAVAGAFIDAMVWYHQLLTTIDAG